VKCFKQRRNKKHEDSNSRGEGDWPRPLPWETTNRAWTACYIIGEIGIKHKGDLDIAKKLIDVAFLAGCNAVKFQKDPDLCVPPEQRSLMRETRGDMTYLDYRSGLSLDGRTMKQSTDTAKKKDDMVASCWDIARLIS